MEDTLWLWVLLNICETGIYAVLVSGMMPDMRNERRVTKIAAILIFILMAVLNGFRYRIGSLFSPAAYFYGIVILSAGTYLAYRRELCLIIGSALTYSALVMLLVYLSVFFISVSQMGSSFGMYGFFGVNVNKWFAVIRAAVLFALLISVWYLRRRELRRQAHGYRFLLLVSGSVLSVLVLEYQNLLEYGVRYSSYDIPAVRAVLRDSMLSMITSAALLGVIGALYLKNRRVKEENALLLMKEEMERQKYEELSAAAEQNWELVHDTKNHYLVISEYERSGEYEKLHRYLEDIKTSFVRVIPGIYTGNRILTLSSPRNR